LPSPPKWCCVTVLAGSKVQPARPDITTPGLCGTGSRLGCLLALLRSCSMPVKKHKKPSFDINSVSPEELLKLVNKAGGQRAFQRKYGGPRTTIQTRLNQLRKDPFKHRPAPEAEEAMPDGGTRVFLFSSAQDATQVHEDFLFNLETYRD